MLVKAKVIGKPVVENALGEKEAKDTIFITMQVETNDDYINEHIPLVIKRGNVIIKVGNETRRGHGFLVWMPVMKWDDFDVGDFYE